MSCEADGCAERRLDGHATADGGGGGGGAAGSGGSGRRARWTEADFYGKARLTKPYVVVVEHATRPRADTVIGSVRQYSVVKGDTFLDLARFYGLGYNELEQANPGIDPWIPAFKVQVGDPADRLDPASGARIREWWSTSRRCGSTTSTRTRRASRSW